MPAYTFSIAVVLVDLLALVSLASSYPEALLGVAMLDKVCWKKDFIENVMLDQVGWKKDFIKDVMLVKVCWKKEARHGDS